MNLPSTSSRFLRLRADNVRLPVNSSKMPDMLIAKAYENIGEAMLSDGGTIIMIVLTVKLCGPTMDFHFNYNSNNYEIKMSKANNTVLSLLYKQESVETIPKGSRAEIDTARSANLRRDSPKLVMEECALIDGDALSSIILPMMNIDRRLPDGTVDPDEPHQAQTYIKI